MPDTESHEFIRFIQSWIIVYACLAYTFVVGKISPPGKVRSLLITPVVALFLLLPLRLTSVIFCGLTGLFVSWVGSFKLVLFALGKGPLATDIPNITFPQFLAVGSLPIIISKKSNVRDQNISSTSLMDRFFVFKVFFYALIYKMSRFESHLHPIVVFLLYGNHIYLTLEFLAFGIRAMVEPLLGLDLDHPFNEPMISTSVQNFWGRRWNLAVGSILRTSVYDPTRKVLSPYVGSRNSQRLGVLATFGTSAIMHEIIFYYLTRKQPSWDMTWYFLLNGMMVVAETDIKRLVGKKWQLPWLVSFIWTMSFMIAVSITVMYPKIQQCNGNKFHAAEEFAPSLVTFLNSLRSVLIRSFKGVIQPQTSLL